MRRPAFVSASLLAVVVVLVLALAPGHRAPAAGGHRDAGRRGDGATRGQADAHRRGNAISCGGTAGVSDSFGSALWMLNTLFGLAQTGIGGLNVHMVPGAINSILNPVGGGPIAAQPEFYAMMMFAQAAPSGARIMLTPRPTG